MFNLNDVYEKLGHIGVVMSVGLATMLISFSVAIAAPTTAKAEFEQYEPVPVATSCPTPWDDDNVLGRTWLDDWRVELSPTVCTELRQGPVNKRFFEGVATLYHEWIHSYFHDTNEGDAECLSLYFLRYELRHKWGLSPKAAQKVYNRAWKDHILRGTLYPQYMGTCVKNMPDLVP